MFKRIFVGAFAVSLASCGTQYKGFEGTHVNGEKFGKPNYERHVERRWADDKKDRPANPPEYP